MAPGTHPVPEVPPWPPLLPPLPLPPLPLPPLPLPPLLEGLSVSGPPPQPLIARTSAPAAASPTIRRE